MGAKIRRIRRADPRELNLCHTADAAGVSVSHMSDFERGVKKLTPAQLYKLLKFLNAEYLLN